MGQLHMWSKPDQMQIGLSKHVKALLDTVLWNARSLLNVEHTSLPCLKVVLHAMTYGAGQCELVPHTALSDSPQGQSGLEAVQQPHIGLCCKKEKNTYLELIVSI